MDQKTRRLTNRCAGVAAVASFVSQPIPAADELIVVPIHYWLVTRMAKARGVRKRDLPWRSIKKIIWYGAGARLVFNFSLGLVPVVGAFSNSITAIALTEYLAQWLDTFLENPTQEPPEVTMAGLKTIFQNAVKKQSATAEGASA
jgi:uncharacterized protein (DUF697 family)